MHTKSIMSLAAFLVSTNAVALIPNYTPHTAVADTTSSSVTIESLAEEECSLSTSIESNSVPSTFLTSTVSCATIPSAATSPSPSTIASATTAFHQTSSTPSPTPQVTALMPRQFPDRDDDILAQIPPKDLENLLHGWDKELITSEVAKMKEESLAWKSAEYDRIYASAKAYIEADMARNAIALQWQKDHGGVPVAYREPGNEGYTGGVQYATA